MVVAEAAAAQVAAVAEQERRKDFANLADDSFVPGYIARGDGVGDGAATRFDNNHLGSADAGGAGLFFMLRSTSAFRKA